MRRDICITMNLDEIGYTKSVFALREKPILCFYCDVYVRASYFDYLRGQYKIILTHPEFDKVYEGCECLNYTVEGAKRRYPFLFSYTNPVLWRRHVI